jgi:hypothetical protein
MYTPSFNPEFEKERPSSTVSESHRLTSGLTEYFSGEKHIIHTDTEGYIASDDVKDKLKASGAILSEKESESNGFEYLADNLTSLRGFLNSTKVDSRGSQKRERVIHKISDFIDNLSHDQIVVTYDRQATYHDIALDSSSNPIILPTGAKFTAVESYFEANSRNNVMAMQVSSSILAVLGNADDTPFKGLIR